jgi:tartrate/fumarate subfamily iron-sulfur-dependent hydro-lyase alpha chain
LTHPHPPVAFPHAFAARVPDRTHPPHLRRDPRRRPPRHPRSLENEKKGTIAESALKIIDQNIALAKRKSQPICQDTGSVLFYVDCPIGLDQITFAETAREAVKQATKKGTSGRTRSIRPHRQERRHQLRPGRPDLALPPASLARTPVRLMLKGGGCENVGAQYSLPDEALGANRDLDGCRRAILDAVLQAQGKGCGPGILGVCIGGDRATGYEFSKTAVPPPPRRHAIPNPELAALEQEIVKTSNDLGIGPMGFGGKTTAGLVKICAINRVPASYFVSVSYMCWAYRRQGDPTLAGHRPGHHRPADQPWFPGTRLPRVRNAPPRRGRDAPHAGSTPVPAHARGLHPIPRHSLAPHAQTPISPLSHALPHHAPHRSRRPPTEGRR